MNGDRPLNARPDAPAAANARSNLLIRRRRTTTTGLVLATSAMLLAGVAALPSAVAEVSAVTAAATPVRAAFYYPWFPETENWQTQYSPTLGKYNSSDPAVIAKHVSQAKGAGLDAFIASYWGDGSRTGGRLPLVLDGAAAQSFKIAPYYEPTSIGVTDVKMKSDFDALFARSNHSAWLRENAKPVLFMYNTAGFANCAAIDRIKSASAGRFYINAKVFTGYRTCANQPDSWHQYGPAVSYDQQGLFSANVSPGFYKFNETAPRLGRDIARYKADLEKAKASGAKWQLITSFNEWGEGTSIEPASQWGNTYLDVTRQVFGTTVAPSPSPTTAPPTNVTQTGTCVDGGGTKWTARSVWGGEYTDSGGTRRVTNDRTGFTSASALATTVDYSMQTYNGAGSLLQTLAEDNRAFNFTGGTSYLDRDPLNPPTAPGKAKIIVRLGDGNDGYGNCSITFVQPGTATPSPTPTASPSPTTSPVVAPVVAAAGDIACEPGRTVGTSCQHKAVADKIIADTAVGTVLTLGDNQYNAGTLTEFQNSFHPTWGRFKNKIRPAVGNHEYGSPDARGYFDYFGAAAGDRSKGYYAFNVGSWRLYALNSERDITASGAQVAWLKADLAANPRACVAAYWHKPRFSSGSTHGDNSAMDPLFRTLYNAGAELVLSGHDHNYERFYPLNPSGARDDTRGLVQIVSGNGGKNHYQVAGRSTTAAKDNTSYGYSRLVLHAGSADISFVSAVGTYRDSTRITCH